METTIVSALAAVLGSLAGGTATLAAARLTQRSLSRREGARAELEKRELLYTEFVVECTKLAIDAYTHELERPEKVLPVFAVLNRIRLTCAGEIVAVAERTVQRITEQYFAPNLSIHELRELAKSGIADPLSDFSRASRDDLAALRLRAQAL